MRKTVITLLLCCLTLMSVNAKGSYRLPDDMPTVEALINLHKLLASWEGTSAGQVAAGKITQDSVTAKTNKFYQVRDMLNSKMDAGYQWTVLAASVSRLTLSVGNLIKDYKDYTQTFYKCVGKNPVIALDYASTNYNLYNKIKLIQKSLATVFASNTGIFKCSMQERMEMLMTLQGDVSAIRYIIRNANIWMSVMTASNYHYDYIWEILNNEVLNKIAMDVCVKWQTNVDKYNSSSNPGI